MKKKPAAQSAFFNPRVLIGVICLFGALLALFAFHAFPGASALAQGPEQNQQSGTLQKVSVSDAQLVQTLKSQGARVIADYGSFALLEVNSAVARGLTKNRSVKIADENNLILLNAGTIDTGTPEAQTTRSASSAKAGNQMRLIQFAGPIRPEWYQALVATGARIVTYIPNNAYLVYGNSGTLQAVQALASDSSIAQWDGEYTAAYRLDPAVTGTSKTGVQENLSAQGHEQFIIQLVEDPSENAATLGLIGQHKLEPIIKQETVAGYVNVTVVLPRDVVIHQLAERVDVVSIQQWGTPRLNDERQDIIISGNLTGNAPTPMNYLTYLTGKGFDVTTTANFAVNISDDGLDNATTTPTHFGLYRVGDPTNPANSRVVYARRVPAGAGEIRGCGGHGTLNSHIIMGYVPSGGIFGLFPHADASGFRYGLGVAPFVKIGSSVIFSPGFTGPTFQNLESTAYADGARISSNSWGNTAGNAYTVDSQSYDRLVRDAQPDTGCVAPTCISTPGNQEYTIVFAAGNGGSGANTVRPPSTAKNMITVGAAENVQAMGGADGCGTGDTGADSANDIIAFSSRGPASDQRKKPDIMGPGTHVSGGVAQETTANPTGSGLGDDLACFGASSVCGGTAGNDFFPNGQEWWTSSSGTSHSCPATAGVAALIRQHFINQTLTPPSPAMTKALIMNSARYMTGVGANDTLPSNNQGMGEINLNTYFDIFSTANILRDQGPADLFTATGQTRTVTGTISNSAKPLRITLAWTDVPGPTSGNAFVNNLDLEVTAGGNTYLGNVFTGAVSSTGGTADIRNNVESVFVPAGVTGPVVITIKATNIAGDGVPGNGQALDQDFALVVYNVTGGGSTPVITAGATAITSESCAPANSAIDPGETVTINFGLSNVGTADTTNLVATLQATGGVTSPSGPQNYGVVVAGGSAVTRPFTFTSGGTCGQVLTATFQLQDGATNLGTASFNFQTGILSVALTQNFDGVTAPALPAGWVSTFTNGAANCTPTGTCALGTDWATSTTSPDTAPNSVFHNDPSCVTDSSLETPTIALTSGTAQVTFQHNYTTESTFDGGVLEISINGGAFADILTAGGSFVAGGYNSAISTAFLSPIAGRQAWNGTSGGYVNATANLPAAAAGQNVKLRFRFASDCSVASTGWRIDTVQVSGGFSCCGVGPTPSPTPTATATSTGTPSPTPTSTATATATPVTTPSPAPCGTFSENFDGVTAPVLPAGWVAAFTNGAANCTPTGTCALGTDWATSATTPDSAPNTAFHNDPSCVTNSTLDTPAFAVSSASAQVTFRNNYILESTFDGGVLEVSSPNIAGGAFTDITNPAVGGSFVSGGYNATISTAFLSPIAGRMAWSGTSAGGFLTSVANLGPNVVGQSIKLRFRLATDCSVAATGWRVDTIVVTGGPCGTPSPTPTATATSTGTPSPTATATATATGGPVNCNTQPGIIIHDDGSIENGYSGNPATIATFNAVDKFTPTSYPATFSSVCAAFITQGGTPTTLNYSVIVYDDDGAGGSPGTQLGALPTVATGIPGGVGSVVFQTTNISSLGITIGSGSVYIGVRYTPSTPNVFTASDESTAQPIGFAGGFLRFDPTAGGTGTWGTTQTSFPAYRSLFVRAVATIGGTPPPTPTATSTVQPSPTPCGTFSENFDGVTAPALPAGWLAAFTNGAADCTPTGTCALGTNWATSATTPDSAPNTAFHNDPSCVTNSTLDTPAFAVSSASAQVTFRNNYILESTFDGGVLEVSSPNIAGGAFTDITNPAVGGSFVSGGYNATISTAFLSPIAGRMAWSGTSAGGFLTSVANLGPNVVGQSIKLRFRLATDCSVAATGWRVDTIVVTGGPCGTPSPTPTATATSTGTPSATATATATATGGPVNCNTQPGIIIHDDGTIENGYSGNPATIATFNAVDKFTPATYPATFSSVCAAFITQGGTPTTLNYSVIVYDDDGAGGSPGTELGALPTVATGIPGGVGSVVFQTTNISSLGITVASGSVYIGVRYTPATPNVFTASDESTAQPIGFAGGFLRFDPTAGGTGTWGTTQTSFPAYRSLLVRAVATTGGTPPPTPTPSTTPSCPPILTQSSSQTVTAGNSGVCNNGVAHRDNSYWRAFDMLNSAVGGATYTVNTVSFGVQTANNTQPVTVRLYTTTNFPAGFPGSLTQIGTTTISVTPAQAGTVVSTPLAAVVPGGTSQLVMEVFTPDGIPSGNLLVMGSNAAPQSGPSYISAAGCNITVPTDTAGIGFPDMHLVFNVIGGCGTPSPTPTATATATATPTATATATGNPTVTPTPTPGTPTPTPNPVAQTVNLSTRMLVQTGANVGIGGFILTGTAPKEVLLRAIGPSLTGAGVPNALADPVMELHGPGGFITITNNNWRDTQEDEIKATGLQPTNDLESAILVTLNPGNYSAIVRGNNGTTGVALVELYDLDQEVASRLANISTRASVGTGANVVIAGFILGNSPNVDNVIIRGIGPSLTGQGVPNALADPTLELHNGSGTLIFFNDNWQDNASQAAIISAAGLAPGDPLESAMAATLQPGNYTAILAGQNTGTGVGLVEVYDLADGTPFVTPTPGVSPSATPTATATATVGGPTPTATATATSTPIVSPTPGGGPCVENFDGVTAPALPAGWVATNPDPGDGVLWVTSNVTPDNPPNDAFIPDQDGISDKVLDRTGVAITSTSPVMTFRNHFDTEVSDGIFWDGFVLEVSAPNISGGAFLDITDSHVGGSMVTGGYTGVLSLDANNPLAGRMAWSGSSGGYIDTAINLGPNLNGQTVTLRFRMGTDEAVAAKGVRVDHILITGAACP